MRSENRAYSIAYKYFYELGYKSFVKMAKESVNLYRSGLPLNEAMRIIREHHDE